MHEQAGRRRQLRLNVHDHVRGRVHAENSVAREKREARFTRDSVSGLFRELGQRRKVPLVIVRVEFDFIGCEKVRPQSTGRMFDGGHEYSCEYNPNANVHCLRFAMQAKDEHLPANSQPNKNLLADAYRTLSTDALGKIYSLMASNAVGTIDEYPTNTTICTK